MSPPEAVLTADIAPAIPAKAKPEPVAGVAARDWLILGATLGLASGFGELAFLGVRKLLGHWLRLGPHALWMIPLFQAALGTAVALGFAGLQAARPGIALRRTGATVLVVVALLPLVVGQPWVSSWAAFLLALGFGVQVGRSGVLWRLSAGRARRLGLALAMATGLMVGGAFLVERLVERRRTDALGPAPTGAPNVLFLILDTVRAASMGLYGGPHPNTPRLGDFAREGTVFTWAFAPSPWTLPTHASLFTGRWPHELSADWMTPLDARDPTLAEVFGRAGYATGGFVANSSYLMKESGIARGFQRYRPFPPSLAETVASTSVGQWITNNRRLRRLVGNQEVLGRKTARAVNVELLDWLAEVPMGRPFFAALNYYDAHEPFLPPAPYRDAFGPGRIPLHPKTHFSHRYVLLPEGEREATDAPAKAVHRAAYHGAIGYLDAEIGRLLDQLRDRGLLDRTIVVITSDHGEGLGENGRWLHGTDLYSPTVRVPLIIRYPDAVAAGQVVDEVVSLRDLAATIAALADLPDSLHRFPGTPLLGKNLAAPTRGPVLLSVWPWGSSPNRSFGLVDGEWHYIRTHKGGEELFRFRLDSMESHSLAERPEYKDTLAVMRERLEALLSTTPISPRPNSRNDLPPVVQ